MTSIARSGTPDDMAPTRLARVGAFVERAITAVPPSLGIALAAVAWSMIVAFSAPGHPWSTFQEARCYWLPTLEDPYRLSTWTSQVAYVYSPAFLQLMAPISWLPWPLFVGIWAAILIGVVRWLTGPRWLWLAMIAAAMELSGGNISLLLALAVVLGFRWPATWAFILLTKITPGIGLLWFAVRREWRQLGLALAATAIVVVVSAAVLPGAWRDWIDVLMTNADAGRTGTWAALPIPLWARLPAAAALVVWGARTDRRWTVLVASMIALPALWYGGFSMLIALFAIRREEQRESGWDEPEGQRPMHGTPLQGVAAG